MDYKNISCRVGHTQPWDKRGAMGEVFPTQAFSDAPSWINLWRHFCVQYGLVHPSPIHNANSRKSYKTKRFLVCFHGHNYWGRDLEPRWRNYCSSWALACALQQEQPLQWEARAPQLENSPSLPQLEKACTQQWRPRTANNKSKYIYFLTSEFVLKKIKIKTRG